MKSRYTGPPKPERGAMAMLEHLVLYIQSTFIFSKKRADSISALANLM